MDQTQPPSLIVAMDRQRVIGNEGRLPWHLSADLQRFKRRTMGHHIIMGRRTWESIGRLLPGRVSIVITRNPRFAAPGALLANSLSEALALASADNEPFVIGGEQVFRAALPLARRIYLTQVLGEFPGDVWFPELSAQEWKQVHSEHHRAIELQPAWDFSIYERATTASQTPPRP
jgi:dihydrofolate reductase